VSGEPAGPWQVGDRIAVVLAVVPPLAGAIFAFLGHYHFAGLDQDKQDLIVFIVGLGIGGVIAMITGERIRSDTFRKDRGRSGTVLLAVGVLMIVGAVAGGVSL
jgi:MFS family permease